MWINEAARQRTDQSSAELSCGIKMIFLQCPFSQTDERGENDLKQKHLLHINIMCIVLCEGKDSLAMPHASSLLSVS